MMFAIMLRLELRKLRGTLVLVLCLGAPLLVTAVAALIALKQGGAEWRGLLLNAFGLWCYFVLPLTVAALAALLAQIEHAPRAWDHLFALPVKRGVLLTAKAAVLMALIGAATALLPVMLLPLGALQGLDPMLFPWRAAGMLVLSASLASALMAILQLWVALAIRSFVAPVALGLAGTFAVVAAMGAPEAAFLPWGMPLATIPVSGGDPWAALLGGAVGGLLLAPAMAWHLARREF